VKSIPTASVLSLARAVNLRDLGGMPSRDGRRVRIGRVYRSAALTASTPDLDANLRQLGIRTVVDLRHNLERAAHPSPWEAMGSRDYWCHDHDAARGDLKSWIRSHNSSAASMRAAMLETYRELPYAQIEAHRYLFNALIDGRTPLLFNCSAGKDRTGVAAAIVLAALGVEEDAILADYLATAAFDLAASRVFRRDKPTSPERAAILLPLFATDPTYLAAMFESLQRRAGSLESYLHGTLGIDAARLAGLRDQLLER